MASDALLLKFKATDTEHTVTRKTVRLLAEKLGFNETQVIQYALANLRREVLPRYELDNGPVPTAMIEHLRETNDQEGFTPTQSLLTDL